MKRWQTEEQRNEKVTDRQQRNEKVTEEQRNEKVTEEEGKKIERVYNNSNKTETHTISVCTNAKRGVK